MGGTLILTQDFFMNFLFSPHGISVKRVLFFPPLFTGEREHKDVAACPACPGGGGPDVLSLSSGPCLMHGLPWGWRDSPVFSGSLHLSGSILLLVSVHLFQEGSGLFQAIVI